MQSVCDGAALAAANRTDEAVVYSRGVGTQLPLTRAGAQAAVADQLAGGGTRLDSWSAETDGAEVTVRCTRYVDIAFGWLFLGGRPLERTAVASARAPDALTGPPDDADGPRPERSGAVVPGVAGEGFEPS